VKNYFNHLLVLYFLSSSLSSYLIRTRVNNY